MSLHLRTQRTKHITTSIISIVNKSYQVSSKTNGGGAGIKYYLVPGTSTPSFYKYTCSIVHEISFDLIRFTLNVLLVISSFFQNEVALGKNICFCYPPPFTLKDFIFFSIFCEVIVGKNPQTLLRCNAIQSLMQFLDDVFVEGKQSNKVKELLVQENRRKRTLICILFHFLLRKSKFLIQSRSVHSTSAFDIMTTEVVVELAKVRGETSPLSM